MNQDFNPLEYWSKEEIRKELKKHSKLELLRIAMQWRVMFEQLTKITNDRHRAEHSEVYDDTEDGKSVED
jgi:hypothetical protein